MDNYPDDMRCYDSHPQSPEYDDRHEQDLLYRSDKLADKWAKELDKSGMIKMIDRDYSDISYLEVKQHLSQEQVLRDLAYEYLENLEWG